MKKIGKKRVRLGKTMSLRFTLLVMVELIVVCMLAWIFAEILNLTLNMPIVIWLVLLSLIIGSIINSFFGRSFFEPIGRLGDAMQDVAEGDFSIRLEEKHGLKEINDIYANFNLMVKELGATEILQTDFVSNVSHEFKTPISAIEGYATLLQDSDVALSAEQEIYIEKILLNTRRLSNLVGNILLLSKVDSQVIKSQQTKFRLDEQIRQSIVMLEPEWAKKEIEIDADLEDLEYAGAENLLHHVWYNLISNAIKFSPTGETITIRMHHKEEKIIFSVEDNGPGIDEETGKHIFDKFYQADSSHKEEGNGLGLALVKQIVTVCDGEVFAENKPEGGCRFTVIL